MAMYRILFLLAFVLLVQPDSSATSIAGSATDLAGGELFVYRLDDAFVNRQTEIGSVTINDDGSFFLNFALTSPHLIRIYCREWMGEFYAFPDVDYTMELRKPEYAPRKFCDNMLDVFVSSPHSADANTLMSQFQNEMEMLFDATLFDLAKQQSKGNSGYRKVQREKLLRANLIKEEDDDDVVELLADSTSIRFDAFANRVYSWIPPDEPFTEQLLLASLASLDHSLGKSPERIAKDYQTIKTDLTNPEYVRLFRQINFAPLAKRHVSPSRWEDLLISMAPADSLISALDPTSSLNKEEASMLTLLAIEQTTSYIDFSKKKTQAVIARFASDPILGAHCTSILENSMQGTRADDEALPDVVLLNNRNDRVRLNDFNGSLVYLFFVDSSMPTAQKEISALTSLISQWTSKMTFLVIEMGEGNSVDVLQSLARADKIVLLRSGNTPAIRHHFNLKSIPTGYLVGTDNRFIDDSTPLPADGLPHRLEQLFSKENKGNGRTWRD